VIRFVSAAALLVLALGVLPYLAHRLRRRKAEDRPFVPADLVPPAPPRARRRAHLEDRPLFALRVLSILLLALLGATPLVRCSRLSLERSSGASAAVGIVLDDSMSMAARFERSSRFERAVARARELLASLREGDAVAVVLAGAPPRVALAATTDLSVAKQLLGELHVTGRATDLAGAMGIAEGLVRGLPQADKQVVVFSDLADGSGATEPLGGEARTALWFATPELAAEANDCAVIRADSGGGRVHIDVACTTDDAAKGRTLAIYPMGSERVADDGPARPAKGWGASGAVPLAKAALGGMRDEHISVTVGAGGVPNGGEGDAVANGPLVVELVGDDAIASNDAAPVLTLSSATGLGVVADSLRSESGPSVAQVIEHAFAALRIDAPRRPLAQLPDRSDDLLSLAGIVVDDPPGFTPEQRRTLGAFVEGGGTLLVFLGPRASSAPLGASFEPFLTKGVSYGPTSARGAAPQGRERFGPSMASFEDLGAERRVTLAAEDRVRGKTLLAWKDDAPLLFEVEVGRGLVWVATLPLSVEESDLALRSGFLAIVESWAAETKRRARPARSEVGVRWTGVPEGTTRAVFWQESGTRPTVDAEGELPPPDQIGLYTLVGSGKLDRRVVEPARREIDLRPRAIRSDTNQQKVSDGRTQVDIGWAIALILLAVATLELLVRVVRGVRKDPQEPAEASA
jgi:hypothetical protein